eukprot:2751643-Rhodomonas_salina.1
MSVLTAWYVLRVADTDVCTDRLACDTSVRIDRVVCATLVCCWSGGKTVLRWLRYPLSYWRVSYRACYAYRIPLTVLILGLREYQARGGGSERREQPPGTS